MILRRVVSHGNRRLSFTSFASPTSSFTTTSFPVSDNDNNNNSKPCHLFNSLVAVRGRHHYHAASPLCAFATPYSIRRGGGLSDHLAEGTKIYAIPTTATSKLTILGNLVTVYAKGGKTIVFTQTKRDADEVSMALTNSIPSEALHGDISQHQRERTLNGFRQGKFTVLVATDVACRGLDIPNADLVIHYELPDDPESFVHRSGCTGRAGKGGTALLLFTSSQRRTVSSLERDVGRKFEFVSPPAVEEVLESSADRVVAAVNGVHPESVDLLTPTTHKLIGEQRINALAAAISRLGVFSRPPSSRSLISHKQGWVTLQLTRDSSFSTARSVTEFLSDVLRLRRDLSFSRGFLSARSVTEFLSDVYPAAADEVGKILLIADDRVQIAVFDVPEEIAKKLLTKQLSPGNSISTITKLPPLLDEDRVSRSGGSFRNENSWSRISRSGGDGDDRSSRLSSRDKRIVIVTMIKAFVTIVKYSWQYLFRHVCALLIFALLVIFGLQ